MSDSLVPKRVVLTLDAVEQLLRLPAPIARRLWSVLRRLREWPAVSGIKPLSGPLAGEYRIRTGDYRVQFRVRQDRVEVTKVGHREGFYDN
jgi:mRNA-degrading endonuclease RelE of RelBE toxin-antitoxin system